LRRQLREAGLTETSTLERRALPAVHWLARSGVALDGEAWGTLAGKAQQDAAASLAGLTSAAPPKSESYKVPGPWVWNSWQQVREVLRLAGCPVTSTTVEALQATGHPLALAIITYRNAAKLASTYGSNFLTMVQA